MELGIIEPANESVSPRKYHYILHHPVIGEDKNTSKDITGGENDFE